MHDSINKILNPIYGVPSHLSGGAGHTPEQAFGVEVKPLPALADLDERRSALNAVTKTSQEGSMTVTDLVFGVEPEGLAQAIQDVAVSFATQQLLGQGAAEAHQQIMSRRIELLNSAEMFNWQLSQLSKPIAEAVKQLKEAASELGETLLSVESKDPTEISVATTGRANEAIRRLVSLSRKLPTSGYTISNPTQRAMVYARPSEQLPELLLIDPEPEAVAAHEVVVTMRNLAKRAPGGLLAALALDLLPGYSLDVAESWEEVQDRCAMVAGAGKPDNSQHNSMYVSMGTGGDTVGGGGGGDLPSL